MPAKIQASIAERIAASSVRVGECLIWQRPATHSGYGLIWIDGRHVQVHRAAYAAHHGPIPAGKLVMHRCDVRLCVEPAHLSLGTFADNTADMIRKGRARKLRGDEHPCAKLNSEAVKVIRQRYRAYSRTSGANALAREFGVADSTITMAVHGRTWRSA